MEIMLEIDKDPALTSYWSYADLISIVSTVDKKNYFLANHYNNLTCNGMEDDFFIIFCVPSGVMSLYRWCPYVEYMQLSKDYIREEIKLDVLEFVRSAIEKGYYVLVMTDTYYIREYGITSHFPHEMLAYGFSDTEQRLYFCDHDVTGKFRNDMSCSFESFIKAYKEFTPLDKYHDFNDYIYLLKAKPNDKYGLDVNEICLSLQDYLCSRPISLDKRYYKLKFGLEVYDYLTHYTDVCAETNRSVDMRPYSVLLDHKKSILATMHCMNQDSITDSHYMKSYKEVKQKALGIQLLAMKYNTSRGILNLTMIKDAIKCMRDIEYDVLSRFVEDIR